MRVHIEELNFSNEADVARVGEILSRAFSKPPWNAAGTPANWNHVVQGWRQPGAKAFVAKRRGQIIGVAAGGQLNNLSATPAEVLEKLGEGSHYYLHTLAVDSRTRRKEVGTALQTAMEQHATSLSCRVAFGETHPKNRAMIGLLVKRGFQRFHANGRNEVYYKKAL